MQRLLLSIGVLLLAANASATSFGLSWDGDPPAGPGTIVDITGVPADQWQSGLPALGAGNVTVTFNGGITDWRNLTTIFLCTDTDWLVILPPGYFTPGKTLSFFMDRTWWLGATTPSLTAARSTMVQWVWHQVSATSWLWGLEDIFLPDGDRDHQDLYGTLDYYAVGQPTDTTDSPLATPEPTTLVLAGSALLLVARTARRRWARP